MYADTRTKSQKRNHRPFHNYREFGHSSPDLSQEFLDSMAIDQRLASIDESSRSLEAAGTLIQLNRHGSREAIRDVEAQIQESYKRSREEIQDVKAQIQDSYKRSWEAIRDNEAQIQESCERSWEEIRDVEAQIQESYERTKRSHDDDSSSPLRRDSSSPLRRDLSSLLRRDPSSRLQPGNQYQYQTYAHNGSPRAKRAKVAAILRRQGI